MEKIIPQVVVGIVEASGAILMVCRAQPDGNLLWCFPGGKVEPGDLDERATVCREILEEAGLECRPVAFLGSRLRPDNKQEIRYWRCQCLCPSRQPHVLRPEEIAEAQWVDPQRAFELITSDIFPPVQALLNQLAK